MITGVGVVCPIGNNKDEFWQNMMSSTSGAAPITSLTLLNTTRSLPAS